MVNSFLQQVARQIIERIDWKQLRNTILVLPSHRAGLVLKNELLRLQKEQHAQAVWAPTVLTLTQLQDDLSPLFPEDELFTIVRLYKLYRGLEIEDPMPLDMFYGWGRQMLADFTNIDASMPAEQVPNFFENTIAAHELEQWKLDPETEERLRSLINGERPEISHDSDSIRAQYERLWQQLYALYQALHEQMIAKQKGYSGLRQRSVIEHCDEDYVQSKIAGKTYVFVGFNYLLPVERELMLRLRDNNQALFYWDYVPNFETNEKAFSFTQLNAGILGNSGERIARNDEPKEVTIVECVSREAQAQYVHRWLQENYTAKGQKTGVVICDENMLESVIYTLPTITLPGEDQPEPINITKGFPLRNTEIYACVLHWLNDPQRGKADSLVSPAFIEQFAEETIDRHDDITSSQQDDVDDAPLTWKELLILESEYQVRKIINQLRSLVTNGLGDVPFTLKLLRLLMRRMMESVTMPFHGEPITDIQIMGVLETRMLDFDRLLLLNVEEGVVPQKQHDISFIPFYLRKAYHMQTSDERATVYAYNFFRLLSRAQHATLLYASAETAEGGKGPSRFIMQILASPAFNVQKAALQEPGILVPTPQEITYQPRSARLTRLSPSALNTFINCPRSYYYQYILGLQPQEEEEVVFSPATMGSFVHHALEFIYTHYMHCDNTHPVRINPDEIEAIRTDEAKMQAALDAAYKAMSDYDPANHVSENVVIKGYVSNVLERDREDAKVGLQVWLLEQKRMFSMPIDGVGDVQLGGIIDRLDIYGAEGNERLRVVDYKSGSYGDKTHADKMSATWEDIMENEDKGYVRQTLIYSHAVLQHDHAGLPVEPNLYFCRRKVTDIETTIDIEGERVSDYAAIQEPFYEALRAKVTQIAHATEFPQCEPDKCPSFCPFFELCGRKAKEY